MFIFESQIVIGISVLLCGVVLRIAPKTMDEEGLGESRKRNLCDLGSDG